MLPIRKILCPTDFSRPSLQALEAAGELAATFSAELIVLHVTEPVQPLAMPPYGFMLENTEECELATCAEAAGKRGEIIAALPASSHCVKAGVRSELREGDAAEEIAAVAMKEEVDLIVIATHGRSGWQHFVFGSVTENLLHIAQCPVLTIRQKNIPKLSQGEDTERERRETLSFLQEAPDKCLVR